LAAAPARRVQQIGRLAVLCALGVLLTQRVRAQESAANGFSASANLAHAAYHAAGVPSVIVHIGPHFNSHAPLQLVVFLHGYNGCVTVLMAHGEAHCRPSDPATEGWDLGSVHDAAGTNTVLVVPQLALLRRDGRPGAFGQPGVFRTFLEEVLRGPLATLLGAKHSLADVAGVHVVAHSGGYQAALALLDDASLRPLLKSVVLFDALYGETPRFAQHVIARVPNGLRFVSIALPNGTPSRENEQLLRLLRPALGQAQVAIAEPAELAQTVSQHAVVIAHGTPPHRLVPEHHLAEVLRALHLAGAL
jgi:hypothetical protein